MDSEDEVIKLATLTIMCGGRGGGGGVMLYSSPSLSKVNLSPCTLPSIISVAQLIDNDPHNSKIVGSTSRKCKSFWIVKCINVK